MYILLVEDDINLSNDLKRQLESENFKVDAVYDGITAEEMVNKVDYDCILADINIPAKNGYELVKGIRSKRVNVPIIMLTAFGEIDDKLKGFESGADDYITKPFFFKELLARVKVLIKRFEYTTKQSELFTIEDLTINYRKREVTRGGQVVRLTAREFEILEMLAEAKGETVSKKDLLNKVWGSSFGTNTNTIEVFINLLRNKIDKQFDTKLIRTRFGIGYYLGKN
jgi:DNA-binding response OmpR family regulator